MAKASYALALNDNIIYVKLVGQWSGVIDLAYLTELAELMHVARAEPWAIFINMREWVHSKQAYDSDVKFTLPLDRRNQIAECWWVNSKQQGSFLSHFIEQQDIPLAKFTDIQQAQSWMKSFGFELKDEYI